MMKFTAGKVVFQDDIGYILKQFHDGKEIASQFIGEEYFNDFCKEVGITSDMIEYVGGATV